MAGALTKYFGQALGKTSIREAISSGGWRIILDGNLAETMIEHGPGGELVGVDYNGNRYYEKKDAQIGRNRWVVYANASEWRDQNSSSVPPEWHGWLHFISDENPTNAEFAKPIFAVQAKKHPTLSPTGRYMPKGAWESPNPRTWQKVQKWVPPLGKGTH